MSRFAVVGGGISGLVAAHRLRAAGNEVTVYEAAETAGGKLRTARLADTAFDLGAEAFLARRPEALSLAAELGLEVVHPSQARAAILAGGRLCPIPSATVTGIPATAEAVEGTLSSEAVRRVAAEVELPPARPDAATTVGGLLRERVGDEVVDRLVDPLLGGVYAGSADGLGLRATMPAFADALTRYGSVLAAARSLLPANPSAAPVFGAVRGGYGALVRALDPGVCTGTTVHALCRNGGGWRLHMGARPSPATVDVDGVVLAVPPPAAAKLLGTVAPDAAAAYGEIQQASMAVVGLAFGAAVELPQRSGILVASGEPCTAKAFTFSSRKWPQLPPGFVRASVGRFGQERTLQRSDENLVEAVRADLAELTGVTAAPVETVVQRWGGGLPQYAADHGERVARIEAAIAATPGLAVAGAALHGVGVPACIATADAAAARLLAVG